MRVVIIDDEEFARRGVRARLARWPDLEIVGEASNASDGVTVVRELRPELVFLDVEMPGADGFSVLEQIPEKERPLAIFVTAHDDRALDAFGVQAFDYLLKPIDDDRLARAVERARERMTERRGAAVERVMIKDRGRVVALEPSAIDWVQSDGDYVRIFAGRNTYLHHATISSFTAALPAQQFVRIHRAAVVNVARIAELQPLTNGDYTVVLTTGARLKLTRTRREQLAERLGRSW